MDTTSPTHLSLCSGYGGLDLGLKRVVPNLRTVAYCERESAAVELLLSRMESGHLDPAPIWTDLRSFPWAEFSGRVDLLSGGYPCQPFSAAGKRLGADDPRHLWPAIADGIRVLRPQTVFFENVEGHITLGLSSVLSDLEELGYEATWGVFSASEVGAPHQRKRVFIMAVSRSIGGQAGIPRSVAWNEGLAGVADYGCSQDAWPSRPGEPQHWWEPPRVVANPGRNAGERRSPVGEVPCEHDGAQGACETGSGGGEDEAGEWEESEPLRSGAEPAVGDTGGEESRGLPSGAGRESVAETWQSGDSMGNASSEGCEGSRGQDDSGGQPLGSAIANRSCSDGSVEPRQRQTQPTLGGNADGASGGVDYGLLCRASDNRTDELRMLGNGVVPATAARAFETLMKELNL